MEGTLESEVIIVGSGAAGAIAAKQLTEGGCRVLLLEAGPDRSSELCADVIRQSHTLSNRMTAARAGQHVQARAWAFTGQTSKFYVDDAQNPYTSPEDAPFLWIRGRQLGGRMHTWARAGLRMSPTELEARDPERVSGDMVWPLSYAELEPYYDIVERILSVAGTPDGLSNVPDGLFRTPPTPAPSNLAFAARITRASGVPVIQNRVAAMHPVSQPPPGIAEAQATGRLTIRTGAVVRHLVADKPSGRIRAVGFHDASSGAYHEARADIVLLCASAFETVRILLNSASSVHPDGVGGASGLLGRYVADHVLVGKDGFAGGAYSDVNVRAGFEPRSASRGAWDFGSYHTMYMPDFTGAWGPPPDFPGGYGIQCGVVPPVWWALAFGEMRARYENRIMLSDSVTDAWGIPVADIHIRHSADDLRLVQHMAAALEELAHIAGVDIADPPLIAQASAREMRLFRHLRSCADGPSGAFHPGLAIHETGGARMGTSPDNSVVNAFCQCWEAPNLFVTDGACFVSPGFQNPTLTIMAITARACDYILRDFR